jgi:hypothetical protein
MRPRNRPVSNIDDENNRGYKKNFLKISVFRDKLCNFGEIHKNILSTTKKYGIEYRELSWIFLKKEKALSLKPTVS